VQWPGGLGAQGSEGITNQVKLSPGAIGYVEVSYAKSASLGYALMKNAAGNFVDATADNVSDAADSLINTSIRRTCAINHQRPRRQVLSHRSNYVGIGLCGPA